MCVHGRTCTGGWPLQKIPKRAMLANGRGHVQSSIHRTKLCFPQVICWGQHSRRGFGYLCWFLCMAEELRLSYKETIWSLAGALTDVTTRDQNGPRDNGGLRRTQFPQNCRTSDLTTTSSPVVVRCQLSGSHSMKNISINIMAMPKVQLDFYKLESFIWYIYVARRYCGNGLQGSSYVT